VSAVFVDDNILMPAAAANTSNLVALFIAVFRRDRRSYLCGYDLTMDA
jgi:hypothetical protein